VDQCLALTGFRSKTAWRSTHLCSSVCFCRSEESNGTDNVIAALWAFNKTHTVHAFSGAVGKCCVIKSIDTVAIRSS